jgi:putative acetyltransferase
MDIIIRRIERSDNAVLARIIRGALEDHGVNRPGTVYTDPTTDALYELFQTPGSAYWVLEIEGELAGGCGIFPTPGLPKGCAELVKLYLKSDTRGKGFGRVLMERSVQTAHELGYTQLYLESLPELNAAVGLYERVGFKQLPERMGDSGHFSCNLWMLLDLGQLTT